MIATPPRNGVEREGKTFKPGVMTRDEYVSSILTQEEGNESGMVAFESLQGLKGSVYFGGLYDPHFKVLFYEEDA